MKQKHTVLFCGTSTLTYTEGDPTQSLIRLAETFLRERAPHIDWSCEAAMAYMNQSMLSKTLAAVDRMRPDTVVLRLVAFTFLDQTIAYKVRERWPVLYRPLRRVSEWMRNLTGGGRFGTDSRLGTLLYKWPRQLLVRVIGTAPEISVPDAITVTRATIEALLQRESLNVIVGLPPYVRGDNIDAEEVKRRGELFTREIRAFLDERRVPYYDPMRLHRTGALIRNRGTDHWHPIVAARHQDARDAAELILAAVVGDRGLAEADVAQ